MFSTIVGLISSAISKFRKIKHYIKRGLSLKNILQDPKILAKLAITKILGLLKGYVITGVAIFLALTLIVSAFAGGISFLFSFFKKDNGDSFGNDFKSKCLHGRKTWMMKE